MYIFFCSIWISEEQKKRENVSNRTILLYKFLLTLWLQFDYELSIQTQTLYLMVNQAILFKKEKFIK
jgi:hypothetical protein